MITKVHTAQIEHETPIAVIDYPAFRNTFIKDDIARTKFNPEGVDGINVNAKSGFYTALGQAIAECEIINAQLNRIDICWDFYDKTYAELYRLAKLLLYCMAVQIGYTQNISDTNDGFNVRKKSVKVQNTKDSNWTFQFEYYNKLIQKPNQPVQARLELRRSRLAETNISELNKVDFVAAEFVSILSGIIADRGSVYTQTINELNCNLVAAYHRGGYDNLRDFVVRNADSFLAKGQLTNFIKRVRPDISNAAKRAKQLEDSIEDFTMYSKSDLKAMVCELLTALKRYLQA